MWEVWKLVTVLQRGAAGERCCVCLGFLQSSRLSGTLQVSACCPQTPSCVSEREDETCRHRRGVPPPEVFLRLLHSQQGGVALVDVSAQRGGALVKGWGRKALTHHREKSDVMRKKTEMGVLFKNKFSFKCWWGKMRHTQWIFDTVFKFILTSALYGGRHGSHKCKSTTTNAQSIYLNV